MGAVVDSRVPNFNITPPYAAAQNDHQDVVMVLIAAGADVNSVNLLEESPLYVAARNGHQGVVQSLIAAGADVNSKDESQISPLHIAALRGHKVVRLLLQLSAGLDMTDREKVMTVVEELLFPSGHTQKEADTDFDLQSVASVVAFNDSRFFSSSQVSQAVTVAAKEHLQIFVTDRELQAFYEEPVKKFNREKFIRNFKRAHEELLSRTSTASNSKRDGCCSVSGTTCDLVCR